MSDLYRLTKTQMVEGSMHAMNGGTYMGHLVPVNERDVHGTYLSYKKRKCRCDDCKAANNEYNRAHAHKYRESHSAANRKHELSIDYEAAAMAHAKNLGDRLQRDGTPFPDLMDEVRVIVDAALGGNDEAL